MSDSENNDEKREWPDPEDVETLPAEYWKDYRVITMLKEGYEIAFNSIVSKYCIVFLDFTMRFIPDRVESEDICVSVFSEMWKECQQLVTVADLEKFLFETLRMACISYIKDRQDLGEKDNESIRFLEQCQQKDVYELDIWGEIKRMLREQKDQLPLLHKKIIRLTWEGKTDKEIRGVLGLRKGVLVVYKQFIEKWLGYSLSSADWLTAFKKGKKQLWEEIYDKYKTTLYSYALHLTNNNISESEELTAGAIAKLWEKKDTIQNEEHIRPWLFRVLKNAFLDNQDKGQRNLQFLNSLDYQRSFVDIDDGKDKEILHAEIIARLLEEIDRLPKRVKAVFQLTYFNNKTTKEVAALLNMKEDAVARDKLKAKQLLKSKILKKDL